MLSGDSIGAGPAEESSPRIRAKRNPFTGRVTYAEAAPRPRRRFGRSTSLGA